MSKKQIGAGLLAVAIILAALAIATLVPLSGSKPNDLGYASACPFAPWSTLVLGLGAGVVWIVRQYIQTRVE
jgi:hypothetical protein